VREGKKIRFGRQGSWPSVVQSKKQGATGNGVEKPMHKRGIIWGLMGGLALLLAGCFRDASDPANNPTSIPLDQFLASVSPARTSPTVLDVPSMTPAPEKSPTSTFAPGGAPLSPSNTPALPATLPIPSFTPSGAGFGDSGLTPTNDPSTRSAPQSLITPTEFFNPERNCVYLVKAGDTLFSIAMAQDVTVQEFLNANPALNANPNSLQIGQALTIPNCTPSTIVTPASASPTPSSPSSTTSEGTRSHTIQQGDTLFRIAAQYGVTVADIVAANPELGSENAIIFPGQILVIPPAP
jgi:LysM repeat protein